jgi:hypothetical protein
VLAALASVHGFNVTEVAGEVRLVAGEGLNLLAAYVDQEDKFLAKRAQAKLWALAELTKMPFGTHEAPSSEKRSEDPATWALQHIRRAPYYLAGMWRRLPQNRTHDHGGHGRPEAFWVGMPDNAAQNRFGRSWIDEDSKDLEGHQALFAFSPVTYEFKAVGIYPTSVTAKPYYDRPYPSPNIPVELQDSQFARYLRAWEANDETLSDSSLMEPAAQGTATAPEKWAYGRTSVAGILYSIHKEDKVSIVADAFRISARTGLESIRGRTRKERLLSFKQNEECFLGYQDQIALVRHPAFWRLWMTEPSQTSLDKIESARETRPLNLMDYADFMAANTTYLHVRFEYPECGLYNFDPTPLTQGALALRSIGLLPPSFRSRLLNGEVLPSTVIQAGAKDAYGLFYAAMYGPLYGAQVAGFSRLLLQAGACAENSAYMAARGFGEQVPNNADLLANAYWVKSDASGRSMQFFLGFGPSDYIAYRLTVP